VKNWGAEAALKSTLNRKPRWPTGVFRTVTLLLRRVDHRDQPSSGEQRAFVFHD
jgi:hypothetical protein